MKKINLLGILLFIVISHCSAQSIGIGMGAYSSGHFPVTFQVQTKNWGGYINYLFESRDVRDYEITNKEADYFETLLGVTRVIWSDETFHIRAAVGVGWHTTRYVYDDADHTSSGHYVSVKGTSFEIGYTIGIWKWLEIRACMGNFLGMDTMIVCKYTFK